MSSVANQLKTIAMGLALVTSVALILGVGLGESAQVVLQPDEVEATTNATFGGQIDIIDRVSVAGAWITALSGLGFLAGSTGNRNLDAIIRTTPLWLGALGLLNFSTDIISVIDGSMDYTLLDDNYSAFIVFMAMSTVAGVLQLVGNRKA